MHERSRWNSPEVSVEHVFDRLDSRIDTRCDDEVAAHADYLRRLVDQIPAFLWVIDRDLIVRRIEGGKPMLKTLDRDGIIGRPMVDVTGMGSSAEDSALSVAMHRRVLAGATERYRATWKGITIEAHIHPLRDRDSRVMGILGVGIDVTEQAKIEERLRGSEERFQAVVEGSDDLVAILDQHQRFSYTSPAYQTVLGYESSDLDYLEPAVITHADDLEYAQEQYCALRPGHTLHLARPVRLRTKYGEWKSFVLTFTDLRCSAAVRGVVVNARDVTKELALEAQLRQSQKLEALGQLAGGVAHDFNNVLAAIMGYAQLLIDDLTIDRHQLHDLQEILKASERAAAITRQLLAFGRQQAPEADRLDLVEAVHEIAGMLRALLPATITLHVSPARGTEPIEVLADRGQLDQILMNLAVNARDAMPDGGRLSIGVRTVASANTAVLTVTDNGTGMTREVQARVFEPFFTTKAPGRGTGLGLATVCSIVRQHSGSIEVDSTVGTGTTVTVRWPLAPAGEVCAGDAAAPAAHAGSGRVLVVDDEAQVREVAERLLRHAGYDVLTVPDAESALASVTSDGPFDVVLTDSAMPGMRGEDLAAEISQMQPGLSVILMSGYQDPARPPVAAVSMYLQKPFTMTALLSEVRRAMARDPRPS